MNGYLANPGCFYWKGYSIKLRGFTSEFSVELMTLWSWNCEQSGWRLDDCRGSNAIHPRMDESWLIGVIAGDRPKSAFRCTSPHLFGVQRLMLQAFGASRLWVSWLLSVHEPCLFIVGPKPPCCKGRPDTSSTMPLQLGIYLSLERNWLVSRLPTHLLVIIQPSQTVATDTSG